jgi:endonuclease/exonuclease/phosphatase family metal-dependent hydrolase
MPHPDLVVLQEWTTKQVPVVFPDPAWHILVEGEMLLASRHPIRRVFNVLPTHPYMEGAVYSYDIELPGGAIRLINLHLASPHLVFRDALLLRRGAAQEVAGNCRTRKIESEIIAKYAASSPLPTLIAGDFNTPPDSETFRNNWNPWTDAFSAAGTGFGVTYRMRWTQTRIDHILFDRNWQCQDCWLGPDVGSPHVPVIADVERTPG